MSRNRVSPEAGWTDIKKRPRGPNGRGLCRQCAQEVPKGRLTFCGDACVDAWRIKTNPQHARERVWERDRGICAGCGLDTDSLARWVRRYWQRTRAYRGRREQGDFDQFYLAAVGWLLFCGFGTKAARVAYEQGRCPSVSEVIGHAWEADHIVPVVEGGGECGLDGLRTLCIPCHKRATRELRARMANRIVRRAMKATG